MPTTLRLVMSLICAQTGRALKFGEEFFVIDRFDAPMISAVCHEIIESIPSEDRLVQSSREVHRLMKQQHREPEQDRRVDVYEGISTRNFTGDYTISGMHAGAYLFSVRLSKIKELMAEVPVIKHLIEQ